MTTLPPETKEASKLYSTDIATQLGHPLPSRRILPSISALLCLVLEYFKLVHRSQAADLDSDECASSSEGLQISCLPQASLPVPSNHVSGPWIPDVT